MVNQDQKVPFKGSKELIKAFHTLVNEVPRRKRIIFINEIKALQKHFGDDVDLIANRQGKHWAGKKDNITCRIDIRDGESWNASYEEAARFVNRKPKYIAWALQARDSISWEIGDNLVTLTLLRRKKY